MARGAPRAARRHRHPRRAHPGVRRRRRDALGDPAARHHPPRRPVAAPARGDRRAAAGTDAVAADSGGGVRRGGRPDRGRPGPAGATTPMRTINRADRAGGTRPGPTSNGASCAAVRPARTGGVVPVAALPGGAVRCRRGRDRRRGAAGAGRRHGGGGGPRRRGRVRGRLPGRPGPARHRPARVHRARRPGGRRAHQQLRRPAPRRRRRHAGRRHLRRHRAPGRRRPARGAPALLQVPVPCSPCRQLRCPFHLECLDVAPRRLAEAALAWPRRTPGVTVDHPARSPRAHHPG